MDNRKTSPCIALLALVMARLAAAKGPLSLNQNQGALPNQLHGAQTDPVSSHLAQASVYLANQHQQDGTHTSLNGHPVRMYPSYHAMQTSLPNQYPDDQLYPNMFYAQSCGADIFVGVTRYPSRDCHRKCVTSRLRYGRTVDLRSDNRYACCCKPRMRDVHRGPIYPIPDEVQYQ